MRQWNADKPHRCPGCHRVWTWLPDGTELSRPRWWRRNECTYCGLTFAGWGWEHAVWRDIPLVFDLGIWWRNLKWKIDDTFYEWRR